MDYLYSRGRSQDVLVTLLGDFSFEATGHRWLTGTSHIVNRLRTEHPRLEDSWDAPLAPQVFRPRAQARCGAYIYAPVVPAEGAPACTTCWWPVLRMLVWRLQFGEES